MNEKQASGLAVIGHQRSGTTLLGMLLNSHPEAALTVEFGCYMMINQSFGRYVRDVLERWLRRRNNPFFYSGNGRRRIRGADFLDNSVLVARYLRHIGFNHSGIIGESEITAGLRSVFPSASVVGDKHPDYWFMLDEFVQQKLLLVAVYRDPRDMVSSVLLKARGDWSAYWPPELQNAAYVAQRWVAFMDKLERNREELLAVCYEELVTDPFPNMANIGAYLRLDPDGFNIDGIRPSSIGKYRQGLTDEELRDVLNITEESMVRYGYKV